VNRCPFLAVYQTAWAPQYIQMESQRVSFESVSILRLGYSLAEAEIASGLSRSTLNRMIAAGSLKTVKCRHRRLIPRAEMERLCSVDQSGDALLPQKQA
jgi:excisionase family DNA binding protein